MSDVAGARARAARRLTDHCVITRPSDAPATFDRITGAMVRPPGAQVYSGPCLVLTGPGQGGLPGDEGGADVGERLLFLELPGGTTGPRRGDDVRIDAVGPDASPSLLERQLEVEMDDARSRQVRTLLRCRDQHFENP